MKRLVAMVALLGLSGCVQYDNVWKAHGPLPEIGEVVIEAPVDVVWQRLHDRVGEGGFVIVGEDAEKREMTVTLQSWQPSGLIDCGRTDIYKKNAVQELHNVTNSADSLVYERYALLIYYVYRQTALLTESVARLREQAGATAMAVDTTYTLTIRRSKKVLSPGVPLLVGPAVAFVGGMEQVDTGDAEVTNLSFRTNEESASYEEFSCVSKGELEKRILDLARTPAPGS